MSDATLRFPIKQAGLPWFLRWPQCLVVGVALLFLVELVVGAGKATRPMGFYRYFPTIDLTPSFSEHYARNFGGAALETALFVGIALLVPKAPFVVPAPLAYPIFSVPNFFDHVKHLEGATLGDAVVTLLGVAAVCLYDASSSGLPLTAPVIDGL